MDGEELHTILLPESNKKHVENTNAKNQLVTPDNLSKRIQLEKKTALSDFFQPEKGILIFPNTIICTVFIIIFAAKCKTNICIQFFLIYISVSEETVPVDEVVHNLVTCDICMTTPIKGVRFKCKICPNFDICKDCRENNRTHERHKPDHDISTIKKGTVIVPILKDIDLGKYKIVSSRKRLFV